ncbi:hypothetical protein [Methylobacterium variabile]|nr:hypothetical protein [Methylobacterium variabile]
MKLPPYGPAHHPAPAGQHTRESLAAWEARMEARREPPRPKRQHDPAFLALLERRLTPDRMSPAVSAIYARTAPGHDPEAASDFQADAGF